MALNPTTLPMPLAPSSLTHAIAFLTRPLANALLLSTLAHLHAALRAALTAAYVPNRAARLVLSFGGPGSPPPPPVFAASVAARVPWAAWMGILAPRRFDLVIEPRVVSVEYPSAGFIPAQSVIIWSEASSVPRRSSIPTLTLTAPTTTAPEDDGPQVPISKSRVHAALRATLHSAIARSQTRTLAQQLLAVEEEKEADELFAMLSSGAGILSPTPTRDMFPVSICTASVAPVFVPGTPAAVAEEEVSPGSSRPSSRSSSFSAFSSVYDSDEESLTSASSVASFDFLDSTKPVSALPTTASITATAPIPVFSRRVPTQPFVPHRLQQQPARTLAAAAAVPAPASPVVAPAPRVFIDSTKKEVTKYLYQGGVSTVLTGGVMLGGGKATAKPSTTPKVTSLKVTAPSKPAAAIVEAPKYRAPIGSGKWRAPTRSFVQSTASAGSWRRAPAATAACV